MPKQVDKNGLTPDLITFKDSHLEKIIMEYTAESGVRNLERSIGSVCRTVAYDYAICKEPAKFEPVQVTTEIIEDALGLRKYEHQLQERITQPGVAIGLAYTAIGGSALLVETAMFPGTGQIKLTGKLGEVMRESVNTCISWIQYNSSYIGILNENSSARFQDSDIHLEQMKNKQIMVNTFKDIDLHVHFPAAATPKDGPSAGVTITVALVSLFTGQRVRSDVAMTGELSLQGLVLPIGGVKEKCMAAHRNGIKNILLPKQNKKDIGEIPKDLLAEMNLTFCGHVGEYLEHALEKKVDARFVKQTQDNFRRAKGSSLQIKEVEAKM